MGDNILLPITQQCVIAAKQGIKFALVIDDTQFNFNGLVKVLNLEKNEIISYVHKDDIVRFVISLLEKFPKTTNKLTQSPPTQRIGSHEVQQTAHSQVSIARKGNQIKSSFYASLGVRPEGRFSRSGFNNEISLKNSK